LPECDGTALKTYCSCRAERHRLVRTAADLTSQMANPFNGQITVDAFYLSLVKLSNSIHDLLLHSSFNAKPHRQPNQTLALTSRIAIFSFHPTKVLPCLGGMQRHVVKRGQDT